MNVIYSSKQFWILAYPEQHSFELFDKQWLRTLFLDGPLATHFCEAMGDIPETERNEERIDALLDEFCDESAHSVVFH
jgi:hypothetical protein